MKWISVKDRLPSESMDCFVVRDGEVDRDRFIGSGEDNGYWWNYLGITHWMPMPELP